MLRSKERVEGYDCLDRVVLVMNRGSRASQVVDLIHLEQDRLDHIMPDELKPRISEMVQKVLLPSREEVVNNDHTVTAFYQTVHQMAPHETGPTSHQHPQTFPFQPQRNSSTCTFCQDTTRFPSRNRER